MSSFKGKASVNLPYVFTLILVVVAIVGVYIDIPLVSQFAFWIVILAYVILAGMK